MKKLGYILIAFGLALLLFVFYSFLEEKNKIHSPVPEEKGIKVIFVSPSK